MPVTDGLVVNGHEPEPDQPPYKQAHPPLAVHCCPGEIQLFPHGFIDPQWVQHADPESLQVAGAGPPPGTGGATGVT